MPGEVLRQVAWLDAAVGVGQWHTRDEDEVLIWSSRPTTATSWRSGSKLLGEYRR